MTHVTPGSGAGWIRRLFRLAPAAVLLAGAVLAPSAAAAAEVDPNTPHREVYWNITGGWAIYLFLAAVISLVGYVVFRKVRLWALGRPSMRVDRPLQRLRNALILGLAQHRLPRDPLAGLMHACISASILVLFGVTVVLLIDHEGPVQFLKGDVYLWYSLIGDLFGLIGIIGIGIAIYRRYAARVAKLQWDQRWEDYALVGLTGFLLVSGFFIEGARIAVTELDPHPDWARWSFMGYLFALGYDGLGLSEDAIRLTHQVFWWTHMPAAFVWLALLAFTKLGHIFYALVNAFFKSPSPQGRLTYQHGDLMAEENAELAAFGVGRIQDFNWKQLFDADVCVRCGRCSDACPAHFAGQPLSPMAIIQNLKAHLYEVGPQILEAREKGVEEPSFTNLVGDVISEESLWACRTCGACVQECPVLIEHVPTIVDMRRWLVMDQAKVPDTMQQALMNLEQRGHPWRGTQLTRTSWMQGLDFEVPLYDGSQEYLYWVGCTGALVDRNIPITQSIARLLKEAGVSYGCLGDMETCNGDPARRLGNEYLFQMLAQQNIETFKELKVVKVITQCPHCFNVFKNEYPDFGLRFEVIHHTELFAQLVKEGRLRPKENLDKAITYHDSCYLGRHNNIYDAPRDVLKDIPGVRLVEMPRSFSRGYCCGAGGGTIWLDETKGRRVNHVRTEEAAGTGADYIATACPFCIQMFEDGIPTVQPDEEHRMKVYDISELLEVSTGPAQRPADGASGEAAESS